MPSNAEVRKAIARKRRAGRAKAAECGALVIAIGLNFIPKTAVIFSLALAVMGGLLIYALFQLSWVCDARSRFIQLTRAGIGLFFIAILIAAYGWFGWPPRHRHSLSAEERKSFEEPLKVLKDPKFHVHLACAPNDEIDCEYASELILLFGEAGWDVSPKVDRVELWRPQSGITLAMRGLSDKRPEKWSDGAWLKMTPELEAAYQAFSNIGIESDSTTGPDIPEDQINIYVGHEKENEASPTYLTRFYAQAREDRKKGMPR
jgi:hypothetical protein